MFAYINIPMCIYRHINTIVFINKIIFMIASHEKKFGSAFIFHNYVNGNGGRARKGERLIMTS